MRAGERRERPLICLFGPLQIEIDDLTFGPRDLGGARPKQVLEILLAARGRRVPTDRLADLLWGQDLPQNAAGSLQTFVSVLRRRLFSDRELARELVITEMEAYRFAVDLVDLDLDRFDQLLDRSRREATGRARRSLEEALALVRGEVLEDEPYASWAQELRVAYQGRVHEARLDAAHAALAELDYAAALTHAEAAVSLDPFSEQAHRAQMLSLYALGRQHEALDTYRRFRMRLDEELGLQPTTDLRSLEAAILRQDDARSLLPHPVPQMSGKTRERTLRLLGRTSELAELERVVQEALGGSFALIQIEGEAGLGKTRLLDELTASLAGVRVGRVSCSELQQHLPYVPLAAALRDALHGVALDSDRLPALCEVLPELRVGDPAAAFAEVDALEALVEAIVSAAPLVLLLDDLQWADSSTIRAISYLQQRGAGIRAALVAALGVEEAPPDHLARRLRPTTVVCLEPLTRDDLAAVGAPDLHEATGGNPRFLTAAMATGGRRELSGALQETLLARCRAEGSFAYRLLGAASLLEEPFRPEPLAHMLCADAAKLIDEVERLCERRVLRVDRLGFHFRYGLVRDVLRASLSPARRRLLRERLEQPEERGARSAERAASARRHHWPIWAAGRA
ncbi:MAG TPA: BTAD domain-containing putative transcriptional regulator [Gaiellaceae bacterium]|nr:BTAD domain-containing putative transcriptional regulator [Gaiellaceae bacterium]